MVRHRLDEAAIALAEAGTRREALRRIGSVLGGVLLAAGGLHGPAAAQSDICRTRCIDFCRAQGRRGQALRRCASSCTSYCSSCIRRGGAFHIMGGGYVCLRRR
jgi:hypothetical protein